MTVAARSTVRVMLVDDHALVRAAVRQAISAPDVELVGEAATAEEALSLAATVRPDVLLLDIDLPGMKGVQLVQELAPRLPETKIVMLTVSAAERDLLDAMTKGAAGYLTKDSDRGEICETVRRVARGETVIAASVQGAVAERLRTGGTRPRALLTAREQEVLEQLARGLSAPQIAQELVLSPTTVKTHLGNLYEKLEVSDRAAAVAEAMRRGLID